MALHSPEREGTSHGLVQADLCLRVIKSSKQTNSAMAAARVYEPVQKIWFVDTNHGDSEGDS